LWIVFLSGTGSCRPSTKRMRKARCVIIGEPPFLMYYSTTKVRCSHDQAMV
jgi:hypothetical protein